MMRRDWRVGILAVVVAVLAGACAPRTVHLYSVDTGAASLELHYKDGKAWIGEQGAPECQGEHRTLDEDMFGSHESAELTCKDGRVIECTFELSEMINQGAGTCLDNDQHLYRVLL
jgi:hypothetical protein